ncbi:DUF3800 domain-containing protein [Leisingera caerulea]|uniref:DUF3800 domain-containing protein n=1 Tax=Leisingera caerulea TaxID=506591 RepID=A0A9Q9M057_LEICA|nr:DUF3800 domain-containing protein [Leisingera caerulea]UWQ55941.1 DUF3800 domain-containing protein [Leisingera caerulea]
MTDINDLRAPVLAINNLPNVDSNYTMHYDETNNIRRLHLTPNGLNVRVPQCFVLGGIAHRGAPPLLGFEDLRTVLRLQNSTQELKLAHLGKGDFLNLLNCSKIETLLDWLFSQNLFVHYHVLDPLYWSIVDVVDSVVTENGNVHLMMIAPMLKNDLYSILRDNVETTADLLGQYTYPDVGHDRRAAFIAELRDLLEIQRQLLPPFNFQMLRGLLQIAAKLDVLPYLENEPPNVLIDGFGDFYLQRIALFRNSTHILDIETMIEAYLRDLDLRDGNARLRNFSFVDSKDHPWVQVSDVIAGLLGKFFGFVNRTPAPDINYARSQFTDRQKRSLKMLTHLIGRSVEECPAFVHYVVSLEDHQRREGVLGF